MFSSKSHRIALAAVMFLSLMLALPCQAQKKSKAEIKISKIGCDAVKTPRFKDSEESEKYHWGRFYVKFDVTSTGTKDDWLDSLDIVWKIVCTDQTTKRPKLYSITVPYEDIEKGSGHNACIYLKPKFLRRFTNSKRFNAGDFSLYVELQIDGQKITSEIDTKPAHKALGRWDKEDADRGRSERYLIPKSKTPFASLDYDYWETEKPTE
ncbi:MAG: hypothetical protein J6X55_16185 [Victivallales bacterium]|nr:hypothetical protein [Victivallales bacterium]